MKLRLPHQFQAALMAAIASVSLTTLSSGTAHGAVTLTDMSSWDGYNPETGYALVGTEDSVTTKGTQNNGQQWNNSWSFAITIDPTAMQAGQTYNLAALNVEQNKGSGYIEGAWLVMGENNQATFHFGAWDRADVSVTVDLTGVDDVTLVFTRGTGNKSYFYAYKDDNFSSAAVTLESSQGLGFSSTTVDTHIGALEGVNYFNNSSNKVRMPGDTTVGSYDVYGAGYTTNALPSTAELQAYHNSVTVLQWNGTDNSDWSSTAANWLKWGKGEAMAFTVTGAQALFGKGDGLSKTVNVTSDSAVSVSGVRVAGDYTFNMTGNLNAGKITIAEGASLTRTGSGTLAGTLSGAGTYSAPLSSTGTLVGVTLDTTWAGTVRVSNQTVENGKAAWINALAPRSDTWVEFVRFKGYDSTWAGQLNANIKLTSDGTNNPAWELSAYASAWNTMVANGSWTGEGIFKTAGGANTQMQAVEYKGNISGWTGRFEANTAGDRRVTFSGSATAVNADVVKTGGAKAFEVIVNTNAAFAGGKQVTADTLTVKNGYTATFSGTTAISNGVTMGSGASLVNNGALTLGGTITFGGNPIENNGTITLNSGFKLDLSGLTPSGNTYTVFSGTNTFDFTQISTSIDNITGIVTAGREWSFNNNGTITFQESAKYRWTGGFRESWDYETANWNDGQQFVPHGCALFDSGASVALGAAVEADSLEVTAALTLDVDPSIEGAGLTVPVLKLGKDAQMVSNAPIAGLEEVSIGSGAVWTIMSQGQVLDAAITYGDDSSTIEVEGGASVLVTDAARAKSFLEGDHALTNRGTFEIAPTGSASTVQIANGTAIVMGGILKLDSGVTLSLSTNKNSETTLVNFSQIVLDGGTIASNASMGTLHNVTVTENSAININDFKDMSSGQHTATTTLDGATDIAGGKLLTIHTEFKSNLVMNHLKGAGTLKLTTANRNDGGKTLAIGSMQGFTGDLDLEPGSAGNKVAVTATIGPDDVSMGSLTLGNASASFTTTGDHSLTLTSLTTSGKVTLGTDTTVGTVTLNGNASRLELGADVSLTLAQDQLVTNTGGGTIVLNNGSGITTWDSSYDHTRQLGNVLVKGIATINTHAGAWNATTNIASLSGDSSAAEKILKLQTAAAVNYPTVYNLNGAGDFNGSIELSQLYSGERYLALNLDNSTAGQGLALQGGVLKLVGSTNESSHIGIGLGTDASVRGISSEDGGIDVKDEHLIFSGTANTSKNKGFNNDSSQVRSLTIATQVGDNFTTRAKVQNNVNLVKSGDGSQTFNGDLSAMNGTVTVTDGMLTLNNANTNTAASLGALSVGGGSLVLGGNIGFSSMNITGGTAVVNPGTVTYTGAQAIANSGTFTLNDNIYTTSLAVTSSNFNVGLDGQETSAGNANYFAGAQKDSITVVAGGTVTPNGHKVVQGDVEYTLGADGKASKTTRDADYTTFYHNTGALNLSTIAEVAQPHATLETVELRGGATLTADGTVDTVRISNSSLFGSTAVLNMESDQANVGTIAVQGLGAAAKATGTVKLTSEELDIDAGQARLLLDGYGTLQTQGAVVVDNAVRFVADENSPVQINDANDEALNEQYKLDSNHIYVTADTVQKVGAGDVTVGNVLNSVSKVENTAAGGGSLTLGYMTRSSNAMDVNAQTGNIRFYGYNADADVALHDLQIAEGKDVGFYSGYVPASGIADASKEISVTVSGTLTAGRGATLNANLEMASGSTLDVSADGGVNGLLMGSTVTLTQGMTLNDYSSDWSTWEDGTKYALFTGVDGLNIGSGMGTDAIDYTQWVDASKYFTNITEQNRYFLCYEGAPTANAEAVLTAVGNNGSNVGMVYIMAMPEPTTSTLSLLALCALAARRRRK